MMADVETHPITGWRIVVSGFLQRQGKPNGVSALWHTLHCALSGPHCRVDYKPWRTSWSDVAEVIARMRNGKIPDVRLFGFSWGGYSCVVLARELQRRGIPVTHMVLCDPVYRHWYKAGQWRALWPFSRIEIPANVYEVHWLRQEHARFKPFRTGGWFQPAGHDLVAESQNTVINDPIILPCEHIFCDDHPEFHRLALEVATR